MKWLRGSIQLRYLIDMAEIPTFQEMRQNNMVAQSDDPRVRVYLSGQAEAFGKRLVVTLNGQPLPLQVVSQDLLFSLGAGNLTTMKFGILYHAMLFEACTDTPCELAYRDGNFPGRAGWKEIVVTAGQGIIMSRSSASSHDRTSLRSNYPTDLVNSPPQDAPLFEEGKCSHLPPFSF